MLGVEKTGIYVQVAIKLLDPLHKLPDWYSIWLLQPIADVESLGLGHIAPENHEKVEDDAIHKGLP